MGRKNFGGRVDQRREEAVERNEAWVKLSPIAQLKSLRARGHGHCKQAQKLQGFLEPLMWGIKG